MTGVNRKSEGAKPFACHCKGCEWRFRDQQALSNHHRTHTGEKPFLCDRPGCNRRFAQNSNLRKHQRGHINDISGKSNKRKIEKVVQVDGGLSRHRTESPSFWPYCGKSLPVSSDLYNQRQCEEKGKQNTLAEIPAMKLLETNKLCNMLDSLSRLFAIKMRMVGHSLVSVEVYEPGTEEEECMLNVYTNAEEEGFQPLHIYGIDVFLPFESYSGIARDVRSWSVWYDMRALQKHLTSIGVVAQSIRVIQHIGWAESKAIRLDLESRKLEAVKFYGL